MGGDTAEVNDIKFSNDGKSMLLTTTNNNIYVLDAYRGEKVISHILYLSVDEDKTLGLSRYVVFAEMWV